jgi:hypothetical protein
MAAIAAGVGLLVVCGSSSAAAAMMMGGDDKKKKDDDSESESDSDSDSESESDSDDEDAAPVAPVGTPSQIEASNPETFTSASVFTKMATSRLDGVKSGYPYSQFFVDVPANAVEECKAACKDNSLCPGFSVDWHTGNNVNCMIYKENNGEGQAASCTHKPFSANCRRDVRGKPGVTEGGLWWRGTRTTT